MYIYECSIIKTALKGEGRGLRKCNVSKFDQRTVYTYMLISQCCHFVQLIYASEKKEKKNWPKGVKIILEN
jgi:hypothetical protein